MKNVNVLSITIPDDRPYMYYKACTIELPSNYTESVTNKDGYPTLGYTYFESIDKQIYDNTPFYQGGFSIEDESIDRIKPLVEKAVANKIDTVCVDDDFVINYIVECLRKALNCDLIHNTMQ